MNFIIHLIWLMDVTLFKNMPVYGGFIENKGTSNEQRPYNRA